MTLDLIRRTVARPGVDLAVHVGGNPDGPTLVMVHGWPDTHRVWLPVAEALADRFRIVLYDTRGQGGSAMTEPDREGASFALPVLADDFFAVVDAVSPGVPVHVLAHDWGSIQVWEAVCEPGAEERVASFVSMSGPNLDHLATWARGRLRHPTARGVMAVMAQGMASAYVPFLASPWAGPVLRTTATAQRWRWLVESIEGRRLPVDAHAPTLVRDMADGARYYRDNADLLRGRPRERRTVVPVLQIVLTRDGAVRPASLRESERWTHRLERVELPFGHWAPLTHPEEVARETGWFLDSVRPVANRPTR